VSQNIDSIKQKLWKKLGDKAYRDAFVAAQIPNTLVAQIETLREQRGWTQKELAEKAGMLQSRISVMESQSYDKFTLSTLKKIAAAFDVNLVVRFGPFSELVEWVASLSPEQISVPSFGQDTLAGIEQKQVLPDGYPAKQRLVAADPRPYQETDYSGLGGLGSIQGWFKAPSSYATHQ